MGTEVFDQGWKRQCFGSDIGLLLFGLFLVILFGDAVGPASSVAVAAEPPVAQGQLCKSGSGAGQCENPRGIAADPETGHVFLADRSNNRIAEFTASRAFVKAWGWDVVTSGPGEDTIAPEDEFEICIPARGDVCKSGTEGNGVGQSSGVQGMAVDSAGNVYFVDRNNHRVQKFDTEAGFLLMFGGDVNKDKVEESAPEAEQNLCTAASGDFCQGGTEGTGNGQFGAWAVGSFIAIDDKGTGTDSDDRVYVGDRKRIQIFNTGGQYVGEIPLDPDGLLKEKTVQSLAVDATGDLYIAYDLVVDVRKIEVPSGDELETPRFSIPAPTSGNSNAVGIPTGVSVDSAGNVYAFGPTVIEGNLRHPVIQFEPSGNLIAEFGKGEYSGSTGLATNLCPGDEPPGNLYVSNSVASSTAFVQVYGTPATNCGKAITGDATNLSQTSATLNGSANPKGLPVTECFFEYGQEETYGQEAACQDPSAGEIGSGTDPVPVHAAIGGLTAGTVYHFRLVVGTASGSEEGSDVIFKTFGPPAISGEHTGDVTFTQATAKALVNPEGLPTTCHVEYGSTLSYGKSTLAIGVGKERGDRPAVATLEDLTPGTGYHWRFVCINSSGTVTGEDQSLTTYPPGPVGSDPCANAALRAGPSSFLPDCRAYEMVSPIDKNGGDIVSELSSETDPGGYVQVSSEGDKITYAARYSFGDEPNSFLFNQYLASRDEDKGWFSEGIHPPVGGSSAGEVFFGLVREFMAFSSELCSAWLVDFQTPPVSQDGQEGYRNLYRRDNCEPGRRLEALTPKAEVALPPETAASYVSANSVQGISDTGHVIFVSTAKLIPEAATGTHAQIYDRFHGGLSLVSVLPDSSVAKTASEVGSGWRSLDHAVSNDGSRVFWTAGGSTGKIYLRMHPEQGIVSGECTEPSKACTVPVSAGSGAFFWGGSADGSRALYSEGEKLFEFALGEEGSPRLIASHVRGVAGISDDLSRVYLVIGPSKGTADLTIGSTEATDVISSTGAFTVGQTIEGAGIQAGTTITGVGLSKLQMSAPATASGNNVPLVAQELPAGFDQNSVGNAAQVGEPNLYLAEADSFSFVATLIGGDLGAKEPGASISAYNLTGQNSYSRPTRVTPDGGRLTFQSRAPLTGFDNRDGKGKLAVEVFTYEAGGKLLCVSCNPSGARPSSRELPLPYQPFQILRVPTEVQAAAWIPTWEHPLSASNVLSDDGDRLFFNSNDALLPRDTNSAPDVYEWKALGADGCAKGASSFQPASGGCLDLISSGESSFESEFWGASPDGDDVFFTTESSLLPQDPGLVDLYDARVGGGFAAPTEPGECEGEACQSPPPPPEFTRGASAAYEGPANPVTHRPRCLKGKRRVSRGGKSRCVKRANRGKKKARRANHDRRALR